MHGYCFYNGKLKASESLTELLQLRITNPMVISVVGAGGKTTTICRLAEELIRLYKNVIITTTTHMKRPENGYLSVSCKEDLSELKHIIKTTQVITVGRETVYSKIQKLSVLHDSPAPSEIFADGNKIQSIPPELYNRLPSLCDFLLVEADGSRGLPLKAPASHEPVLFPGSDLVLGIMGMDALNQKIGKVCHRPDLVAELLSKSTDDTITPEDMAKVAAHKMGLAKNVEGPYFVVLNKVDIKSGFAYIKRLQHAFAAYNVKAVFTGN